MNDLHTNVCFDAFALVHQQNVQPVENVCNICGSSHYTQNCPDLYKGEHVQDAPQQNLSRSSVPSGLHIIDIDEEPCVVTSQKYAKGSRFGPLLARRSYVPLDNLRFPLIIFPNHIYNKNEQNDTNYDELFKIRNIYLDTNNENLCNWMIHVNPAKYLNEQNLMCYQLNDQIFYTAIQDIDVGDILKVWYAPKYATKMGKPLLMPSSHEIVNNILRQVSFDPCITLDCIANDTLNPENQFFVHDDLDEKNTVSLPPIDSLIRTTSSTTNVFLHQNNNYLYPEPLLTSSIQPSQHNHLDLIDNSYKTQHNLTYDTETDLNFSFNNVNDLLPDINFSYDNTNFNNIMNTAATIITTTTSTGIEMNKEFIIDNDKNIINNNNNNQSNNVSCTNKELSNNLIQQFSCPICEKKFISLLILRTHLDSAHNLFMCINCKKCYRTMDLFKNHICNIIEQTKSSSLQCTICQKILSNTWSLGRHMRSTHSSNKRSHQKLNNNINEIYDTIKTDKETEKCKKVCLLNGNKNNNINDNDNNKMLPINNENLEFIEANNKCNELLHFNNTSTIINNSNNDNTINVIDNNNNFKKNSNISNEDDKNAANLNNDNTMKTTIISSPEINDSTACVVCNKVFKNRSYLNKHLRNVHWVKIITTPNNNNNHNHSNINVNNNILNVNNSNNNDNIKQINGHLKKKDLNGLATTQQSSINASQYNNINNKINDNNCNITNTINGLTLNHNNINNKNTNTSPIKPFVAKALADKLTERSNNKKQANEQLNTKLTQHQQHLLDQQMVKIKNDTTNEININGNGKSIIIISNLNITNSTGGNTTLPNLIQIGPQMLDVEKTIESHHQQQQQQQQEQKDIKNVNLKSKSNSPTMFYIKKCQQAANNIAKNEYMEKIDIKMEEDNSMSLPNINDDVISVKQEKINDVACGNSFIPEPVHECIVCHKVFNKKIQLQRHKSIHNEYHYRCSFCNNILSTRSSIRSHLRRSHSDRRPEWCDPDFIKKLVIPTDEANDIFQLNRLKKQLNNSNNNNNIKLVKTNIKDNKLLKNDDDNNDDSIEIDDLLIMNNNNNNINTNNKTNNKNNIIKSNSSPPPLIELSNNDLINFNTDKQLLQIPAITLQPPDELLYEKPLPKNDLLLSNVRDLNTTPITSNTSAIVSLSSTITSSAAAITTIPNLITTVSHKCNNTNNNNNNTTEDINMSKSLNLPDDQNMTTSLQLHQHKSLQQPSSPLKVN